MADPLYRFPVSGNVSVEVEASHNIVLRQARLNADDDVITVTNVDALTEALHKAVLFRSVDEAQRSKTERAGRDVMQIGMADG